MDRKLNSITKEKSVLKNWCITYVVILIIPITISIISSFMINNIIKTEINKVNSMTFEKITTSIDDKLQMLENINTTIIFDNTFNSLFYYDKFTVDFYSTTKKMSKMFENLIHNDPKMDIMLYIYDKDYMITSSTANESKYIYDSVKNKYIANISYNQWRQTISNTPNGYYVSDRNSYKNFDDSSFVYSRSYPLNKKDEASGVLSISIPTSIIKDEIDCVNNSIFLIVDKKGKPIHVFSDNVLIEDMTCNTDNESILLEDSLYVINSKKSEFVDWEYVLLIDESSFWERSEHVVGITIITIIISLVLGSISIYFLLQRNYSPIKSLMNLLSGKSNLEKHSVNKNTEFLQIYEKIQDMSQKHSILEEKFQNQKVNFNQVELLKFLKGYKDSKEKTFIDTLEESYQCFGLLQFSFEKYKQTDHFSYKNIFEYNSLMTLAIDNMFQELMDNKYTTYTVKDSNNMYYLLCLNNEDSEGWAEYAHLIAEQQVKIFEEKLQINLFVAVGSTCVRLEQIVDTCQQLNNVVGYLKSNGINNAVYASDMELLVSENRLQNKKMEIYELISNFEIDFDIKIYDIINELMNIIFVIQNQSISVAKFFIFDIVFYIINNLEEIYSLKNQKFIRLYIEKLITVNKITDIESILIDLFCNIRKYIANINLNKENDWGEKIKKYVNENYSVYDLNISTIALHFNLSSKYISQIFKNSTNTALLDYINIVRINNAKLLMNSNLNQRLTLENIAVQVGYSNVRTFSRAFTKIEGVTPGKYIMPTE